METTTLLSASHKACASDTNALNKANTWEYFVNPPHQKDLLRMEQNMAKQHMRQSAFGKLIVLTYNKAPARQRLLRLACKLEGGEMYSVSLRKILKRFYGVEVGDYSYGSLLTPGFADPKTRIGRYASIGPNVRRFGAAHPMNTPSMHPLWYNPRLGFAEEYEDVERGPCEIGPDVWIGANAIILPGCKKIGVGAVIGAGSVVTKDVPPFTIVAGNPARILGERLDHETQERIVDSRPWEGNPEQMKEFLTRIKKQRDRQIPTSQS